MTTNQCPVGNFDGGKENKIYCSKKGSTEEYYLKDRKGETFPLLRDCEQCVCYILNGKPLFLLKFFDEIINTPSRQMRLLFTNEEASDVGRIIEAHIDMINAPEMPSIKAKRLISEMAEKGSTRGHYFRGIE